MRCTPQHLRKISQIGTPYLAPFFAQLAVTLLPANFCVALYTVAADASTSASPVT